MAVLGAATCLLFYRLGPASIEADPRQLALLDLKYSVFLARRVGARGLIVLDLPRISSDKRAPSEEVLRALRGLLEEAEKAGLKIFPACDPFGVGAEGAEAEELACCDERGGSAYWCLSEPRVLESGDKALSAMLLPLSQSSALGGVYIPPVRFRGGCCPRCVAARTALPERVSLGEFRQRLLLSVLRRRRRVVKGIRPDLLMVVHADVGEEDSVISLPNAAKVADLIVVGGSGRSLIDMAFEFDLLSSASSAMGKGGLGVVALDGPCPTRALRLALLHAGGVAADGLRSLLQPVERGFEFSFAFEEVSRTFMEAGSMGGIEPCREVAVVVSLPDLYAGGGGRARALYRALLEAGFPPSAEYASSLPRRAKRYKALVVGCESLSEGAARAIAQAVWSGATVFIFGFSGVKDGLGMIREGWAFDGFLPVQRAGWAVVRRVELIPTGAGRELGLPALKLEELFPEPPVNKGRGGDPPAPLRLEVFRPLPGAGRAKVLAVLPGGRPAIQEIEVGRGKVVLFGLYGPICLLDLDKWRPLLSALFSSLLPRPRLEVIKPKGALDLALRPIGKGRYILQILNLGPAPLLEAMVGLPFPAEVIEAKGTNARSEGRRITLENLGIYAKLVLSVKGPS